MTELTDDGKIVVMQVLHSNACRHFGTTETVVYLIWLMCQCEALTLRFSCFPLKRALHCFSLVPLTNSTSLILYLLYLNLHNFYYCSYLLHLTTMFPKNKTVTSTSIHIHALLHVVSPLLWVQPSSFYCWIHCTESTPVLWSSCLFIPSAPTLPAVSL